MARDSWLAFALVIALSWAGCSGSTEQPADQAQADSAAHTIKATVQMRPGGPVEDVEMGVHEAPVDPPRTAADRTDLGDEDLVVGVVVDGVPVAYPIRYLATTEVMNDRVGDTALSPTW